MSDSLWNQKGSTFSDKSARKEFEITQDEIIEAIKDGKLQYRSNSIHGNPYLRLLRSEVEAFVNGKYGKDYLEKKKLKKELAEVNKKLKRLKTESALLEKRKVELLENIGD